MHLKRICNYDDDDNYDYDDDANFLEICGISQNPDTKDYIIIFQDGYCNKCGKEYINIKNKWCKSCQINDFKKNFENWTSQNKEIDNFIQEMQLNIDNYDDQIFEWIPYDHFKNVKEISKSDSITMYKAIWKNGPLYYDDNEKKLMRRKSDDKEVALKCLHNSQNIINEFLNEVQIFL